MNYHDDNITTDSADDSFSTESCSSSNDNDFSSKFSSSPFSYVTYVRKGDTRKRVPRNVRAVGYIDNIASVKKNAMYFYKGKDSEKVTSIKKNAIGYIDNIASIKKNAMHLYKGKDSETVTFIKKNAIYVYKGEDGEKVPCNVRAVDYIANITSIKANAMEYCDSIMSVIHPDSIIAIEDQAYYRCDSIAHLRLSSSLQTIGEGTFRGCGSITRLELPPTLHTIKKSGFFNCTFLQSIVFLVTPNYWRGNISWMWVHHEAGTAAHPPHNQEKWILQLYISPIIVPQHQDETLSLKTIEEQAFWMCRSLTSIPCFPMLNTIEPLAFRGCHSLTEVTLGPSIISASRDCFDNCDSLIALYCTYRTGVILPRKVTHVIIDPDTTRIHTSAFAGCDCLHNIVLTPAVTTLGPSCFWGCQKLPADHTSAFAGCDCLHNIVLTPAVTTLGPSCFWGCQKLPADFMVSTMVKEVGIGAFAQCAIDSTSLPCYAMEDIYTFVGGEGEMPPEGVLKVVVDESVDNITGRDFGRRCDKMTHLDIQSKSITIRKHTLWSSTLEEITVQENCNLNVEERAVYEVESLTNIQWPNVVNWIKDGEFGDHTSPGNRPPIPTIHEYAFNTKSEMYAKCFKRFSNLCEFW
eukprot:CAMPEP_0194394828 /NCGR_PEP_ID=MMETSP0174-20130528/124072_1 /TAXON_ID=216777 /ORGANISM="Proboscia alata, Strain PI-D3" /LENGTH=632 /DNA_ID=CAMNT_0039190671 /DNA_START=263 /DNA_END=2159 /DNA_ORIENTATION=+